MFTTLLIVAIGILVLLFGVWLFKKFSVKIDFYTTGLDSKFTPSEISLLWKLAKSTELENPLSLFVSVKVLTDCIAYVLEDAKSRGMENDSSTQNFLTKLYKFRTKLELSSDNKKGLESSRALDNNQKLRIVLKGSGIFSSKIMNNAREIVVTMPVQDGRVKIKGSEWEGKEISVYLWRKGDAGYVFDTTVNHSGVFLGNPVLYLRHSENLLRTQKRKAVRTECKINAQLYVIKSAIIDFTKVETVPGYKCLIEDISSDGALIRIGGKGISNVQMKLQFELDGTFIVMYTVVRSVEYNQANNQSRLHLECIHLEPAMRNAILTYVYKVIPEEQKNAEDAFNQLEEEEGAFNEEPQENVTSQNEGGLSLEIPVNIDPDAVSIADSDPDL